MGLGTFARITGIDRGYTYFEQMFEFAISEAESQSIDKKITLQILGA
jgi:hypothetical protein